MSDSLILGNLVTTKRKPPAPKKPSISKPISTNDAEKRNGFARIKADKTQRFKVEVSQSGGAVRRSGLKFNAAPPRRTFQDRQQQQPQQQQQRQQPKLREHSDDSKQSSTQNGTSSRTETPSRPPPPPRAAPIVPEVIEVKPTPPSVMPGGDFTKSISKAYIYNGIKRNDPRAKPNGRPVAFETSFKPKQFQARDERPFKPREDRQFNGNERTNSGSNERGGRTSHAKTSRLFDENIMEGVEEVETLKVQVKHEDLFSEKKFSDFEKLSPLVVAALKQRFKLETATQVQAFTIPHLLENRDALVKSATGSGKTLAYSIPMVQCLQAIEPKLDRTMGIHTLIILPTRELAIQTYDCIEKLLNPFRRIVLGILVGGEKKKSEKARIRKGMNILVTTPGRLLDHINSSEKLLFDKLRWLIIDEADRLYEQGFSAMISQIIEHIQSKCQNTIQTVLLSATLSKGVKELAGLSLKNPAIIDVSDKDEKMEKIVLPTSLENCFMVVPAKLRLVILASILIRCVQTAQTEFGSKIIVFMSCQDVVDYFSSLFNVTLNNIFGPESDESEDDVESGDPEGDGKEADKKKLAVLQLRGNMKQDERTRTFRKFQAAKYGILFCTDVVSRGLDLPNVDLVVQMSCPSAIEDYVHRVGRTARVGTKGKSILFVLPTETRFLQHLQENVSLNMNAVKVESYFDSLNEVFAAKSNLHTEQERLAYLQHKFEDDVHADENLRKLAAKAYLSHLRAYASYPRKMAYFMPFREIHIGHIAKSFALRDSPSDLGASIRQDRRRIKSKLGNTATMKRKVQAIEQICSEFGGGVIGGTKKKKTS